MKHLKLITKIFLLCFVLFGTVSSVAQNHVAEDGKEYLIETDNRYNWFQAFHECARRNSQLVIIDSAAKNKIIIDLLKKVIGKPQNLWLGGNDEFSSSKNYDRPFYWSTTGQKFNFAYWSDNNPDNYRTQEHCVHIWASKPDFQWNDNLCTNTFGFICEVNHFVEKYQNELKSKCAAVKQTNSVITQEFTKTQQQQLSQIDQIVKRKDALGENYKIELQQLQNATQIAVQQIIDQQQAQIELLSEKMFKEINVLSAELKKSTSDINTQFAEKLNLKQNEINEVC